MKPMSDEKFEALYNRLMARISVPGVDKEKEIHDIIKQQYQQIRNVYDKNNQRLAMLLVGFVLFSIAFALAIAGNYISKESGGEIAVGWLMMLLVVALSEVMSRWL